MYWTKFETIGPIFQNLDRSNKLFAPPGVPSWLRACLRIYDFGLTDLFLSTLVRDRQKVNFMKTNNCYFLFGPGPYSQVLKSEGASLVFFMY